MSQEMKAFPGMKGFTETQLQPFRSYYQQRTGPEGYLGIDSVRAVIRGKRMWGNHSACLENNIERVSEKTRV